MSERFVGAWAILLGMALAGGGTAREAQATPGAGGPAAGFSVLPRPGLHALQVTPPGSSSPEMAVQGGGSRPMYKAVLLSAAVPGLGEYYSGHLDRAVVFGSFEGAVWTSFITFRVQENLRARRAKEYAVAFAGARYPSCHGCPDEDNYYKAVSQFLRNDGPGEWNEYVRRKLRDTGETVGHEYDGADGWAWTSQDRFEQYRTLRRQKLTAHDHATNALAFAVVNRIASIVDVVQAVRSGRGKEKRFGLKLEIGSLLPAPQARVGLWNHF